MQIAGRDRWHANHGDPALGPSRRGNRKGPLDDGRSFPAARSARSVRRSCGTRDPAQRHDRHRSAIRGRPLPARAVHPRGRPNVASGYKQINHSLVLCIYHVFSDSLYSILLLIYVLHQIF